jgi:hypothetical protein
MRARMAAGSSVASWDRAVERAGPGADANPAEPFAELAGAGRGARRAAAIGRCSYILTLRRILPGLATMENGGTSARPLGSPWIESVHCLFFCASFYPWIAFDLE